MTIGIVGLGLIGGSLAKAYKRKEGITVLGCARTQSTMEFARLAEAIDGILTPDRLGECDLVLLAAFPETCMEYMQENADRFSKTGIVMDCCGTKQRICELGFRLAEEHGFTFVGGHPMAGTHNSGFKYARDDLYKGAPMVIVPPMFDNIAFLQRIKDLLAPVGFGRISVTTAQAHDEMIAFTSQMCHIVSNAYIKSPTAGRHKGFSAGSYKDLTRVAWLNPDMWSELCLENSEALLGELDFFIASLQEYRAAIAENDYDTLRKLLNDGKIRKEQIDG